jgi:hypothetical protein
MLRRRGSGALDVRHVLDMRLGAPGDLRNGDPTTYDGHTLDYDLEDRMTSWTAGGTTKIVAAYRADGLRAWSQLSTGVRTYYYYDGDTDVVETDSSGDITASNTFGPLGLVLRHVASGYGHGFFAYNPSGNTVQQISSTGSVLETDLYDAYGNLLSGTASQTDPYGFGAQWGLYSERRPACGRPGAAILA